MVGAVNEPPGRAREAVRVLREGVDRSEVAGFDRPPEWTAEAVMRGTGDDATEHKVGTGGVDMVDLNLPMVDGRPLWDRPKGHIFRCTACRFSTYEADMMKDHTMKHYPTPPEAVIIPEPRGAAVADRADSPVSRSVCSLSGAEGDASSGLSQRVRVREVANAVAGGAESVEAVVAQVDVKPDAVRSTVATLKVKGELIKTPDGSLRR